MIDKVWEMTDILPEMIDNFWEMINNSREMTDIILPMAALYLKSTKRQPLRRAVASFFTISRSSSVQVHNKIEMQ